MDANKNYLCYFPVPLLQKLDGSNLKFMMSVFYKMRLNRRIENIEFKIEDAEGISRRAFFMSIKSLNNSYLKISKLDKSTYAISLNMDSKHFTDQDIEHLTRPFRNMLPDMTMHTAQKSMPQAEIKPLDWSTAMGVKSTQAAPEEKHILEIDESKSDIKFKSDTQKMEYLKMWGVRT